MTEQSEKGLDRRRAFLLPAFALMAGGALSACAQESAKAKAETSEETPETDLIPVQDTLVSWLVASPTADYPEDMKNLGRLHILDSLASAIACRDLEIPELSRKFARTQSNAAAPNAVTMMATSEKIGLAEAAFVGAMTIHGAEINDFIPSAFVQPGPAVVSAALAIAENRGATGKEFLNACMVGYEMSGRFPKALGVQNLYRTGIANHGLAPTFGAGLTAASLMKMDAEKFGHVLTYCCQQAAGSWQWLADVEHIEKSFVFGGMGVRSGVLSALMVDAGFTGVRNNLDHVDGFMNQPVFNPPGGDQNREYLISELGTRWELPATAYKRFPTGGPTQPAVQAVLEFVPEFEADQVQSIRIEMPGRWQAFRDAEMPALNLRYLSSIIMLDRRLDFVSAQSLERFNDDDEVRAFMEKVDVVHDPAQEAPEGEERVESARVIVTGTDGQRSTKFVPYVVGFPSHPMSRADVEEKAHGLIEPVLGAARARQIIEATTNIESMSNAAELVRMIAP